MVSGDCGATAGLRCGRVNAARRRVAVGMRDATRRDAVRRETTQGSRIGELIARKTWTMAMRTRATGDRAARAVGKFMAGARRSRT